MEENSETHVSRWVEERLAALRPADAWQPDTIAGRARLRERHSGGNMRGRSWTWAMAAATIVGFGLVAFPAPRTAAQRFCAACLMAAQNLAAKGAGRAVLKPEKERKPAPDFTLYDASGKPVQLSAFKGKVVLLNFWATWCGGCRVEIPWLIEFQQTYGDRGFVVLGVSLDAEGWKAVKPFIEEKKINYRVMTAPTMLPPVSAPISRCRFRCSSISPAASPQRMLGCPARATTRPRLRRCSVRNGPPQPVRSRFRADSSRA